jgi:ABC-type Zn uptake system ZnuABC Zn-binding protein ZnuA
MFNKNCLGILALLVMLSLSAAQCGAQPAQTAGGIAEKVGAATEGNGDDQQEHPAEPEHAQAEKLAPVSLGAGEKLHVVATTSIVADLVRNVGGDLIELNTLLPIGADPHAFQPAPADVAHVADADVVFTNGYGLEGFMTELIENAGGDVAVISCSAGVEPRRMSESELAADAEEHGADGDTGSHAGGDPHTWTTPANAMIFVGNIAAALAALDPAQAETYQANTAAYRAELEKLDTWVKEQIDAIPAENRKLVTDHAIYGYYADRYGLAQIGAVVPGFSTATEPSARELAALEGIIEQQGVKAVFVGNTVNPSLEQRVAEDTGVNLVPIYSDSLGPAGSGAETYLTYIRYNTTAIAGALK